MNRLLIVIAFLLMSFGTRTSEDSCLKMDVMVLIDMSGSVDGHEIKVATSLNTFINRFDLSENGLRIGLLTFSSGLNVHTYVAPTSNREKLRSAVINVASTMASGSTVMSRPLFIAYEALISERPYADKAIIIISDGDVDELVIDPSNNNLIVTDDRVRTLHNAELIKSSGIIVCGVLINEGWVGTDPWFLQSLTTPGYYVETDYSHLEIELKKLSICM